MVDVPVVDNVGRYIVNFLHTLVDLLLDWSNTLVYIFGTPLYQLFEDIGADLTAFIIIAETIFGEEFVSEILTFNLLGVVFGVGVIFVIAWTIIKWFTSIII